MGISNLLLVRRCPGRVASGRKRGRSLQSVEAIKALLPAAIECGSSTIALVGGADPGPGLREQGYDSAYRSLVAICAEAANLGASVMFEPLDRFGHKKRLVGAFDAAHAALNEEDILASLDLAGAQLVNLHLSNAVLDKADPLYGDHHMMPGAPGYLTTVRAAEIIAQARRVALGKSIRVAVEARALASSGEQDTASVAQDFLKAALVRAEFIRSRDTRVSGISPS